LLDSNKFLDRQASLEEIRRRGHAEEAQEKAENVAKDLAAYTARWKGMLVNFLNSANLTPFSFFF